MICMDFKRISERVKYIREEQLNVSQEKLAEMLDFGIATVKRAENSSVGVVDIRFYVALAELSGTSLDELLLGRTEPIGKNKQIKKINYLLTHVTNDELDYVYIMIDNFMRYSHKDDYGIFKAFKKYIKKK